MFQPSAPFSRRARTHSFSSSSSSSSSSSKSSYYFPDESPVSPVSLLSPLRSFSSGIPFSWEHFPGIPKKQTPQYNTLAHFHPESATASLLPLPPNSTTPPTSSKRFGFPELKKPRKPNSQRDPFFDAFMECSKNGAVEEDEEGDSNAAVSRSSSGRFGSFLNLYSSCKKTCAVSESIVYVPRTPRTSFDLLNHRADRSLKSNS